jgi:hypothetical protein
VVFPMPGSPDRSNALGPVGIESRKLWRIASSDSRPMTSPAKGAPASVDARILRMAGPNLADPSRPRAMYRPCTKCVPGQTSIGEPCVSRPPPSHPHDLRKRQSRWSESRPAPWFASRGSAVRVRSSPPRRPWEMPCSCQHSLPEEGIRWPHPRVAAAWSARRLRFEPVVTPGEDPPTSRTVSGLRVLRRLPGRPECRWVGFRVFKLGCGRPTYFSGRVVLRLTWFSRRSVWGWSDEHADSESNRERVGNARKLWAIVGILASNVGAPWKILFGPVAVGLFLSNLLHFLGTGLRRKGQDNHLQG